MNNRDRALRIIGDRTSLNREESIDALNEMAEMKDKELSKLLVGRSPVVKKSCIEELLKNDNDNGRDYEALYEVFKECYPKGMRNGCSVSWRCSKEEFIKRFTKAELMYEVIKNADNERISKALANYIDTFKGDYTYLPAMKYLIIKVESDDKQSRLADILENYTEGQENIQAKIDMIYER